MRSFFGFSRLVLAFVAASLFAGSVTAQSEVTEAPWQDVISHQIQAFRDGDAPEAFFDAGQMFHAAFPDAFAFFGAIISARVLTPGEFARPWLRFPRAFGWQHDE